MDARQAEKLFKALGNRRRLKILEFLKDGKRASVSELAGHLKLSFKSTSKHLVILKNADILESEQISLTRLYYLPRPLSLILKEF